MLGKFCVRVCVCLRLFRIDTALYNGKQIYLLIQPLTNSLLVVHCSLFAVRRIACNTESPLPGRSAQLARFSSRLNLSHRQINLPGCNAHSSSSSFSVLTDDFENKAAAHRQLSGSPVALRLHSLRCLVSSLLNASKRNK